MEISHIEYLPKLSVHVLKAIMMMESRFVKNAKNHVLPVIPLHRYAQLVYQTPLDNYHRVNVLVLRDTMIQE